MTTQVIIAEKPSASLKIATALAEGKVKTNKVGKVSYYEIIRDKNKILIGAAVGHLFIVGEEKKNLYKYPVFDITWKPSFENKKTNFTKVYADVLKRLCKEADELIIATDFDVEGEVIGLNITRFIANKKDAERMKFSTLTKDELIDSYEHRMKTLSWGQAHAGEARHMLDWIYGMNLSRALTSSIRASSGMFKILSSGRVQGPALKILAEREREIIKFKPVPYWELWLKAKELEAIHEKDKFWNESEAKKIYEKVKGKNGKIKDIETKQFDQLPPNPFDLTSLQMEAYRVFRISPKETLDIAQELYTNSYISYPRTSSNQLPPSIGYKKIIQLLGKQKEYSKICEELLKKSKLFPNNGSKIDPAHPAIYPTGEIPGNLKERSFKIYDLIVKRTLSSFGEKAIRETVTLKIDVDNEIFITSGTRTIEKGWHEIYGRYILLKDVELPHFKKNDLIDVKKFEILSKETQPPKRYTPASIIKELEKKGLGTKSTRAGIVDNLYERGYLKEKSIMVTTLGLRVVDALEKYAPSILDEKLTRHFEEEMEEIRENKKDVKSVFNEAKRVLTEILEDFKKKEKEIGKELSEAHIETRDESSIIGKCNLCNGDLRIMYSKKNKSYFIACSNYPKCTNTFSLPKYCLVKPAGKICESCRFPVVKLIRKGKRPWEFCINQKCPKKDEDKVTGNSYEI
ncbi:MAG: DNA topoisomerase I [Candidatus Nanoarchaeia archaeon]|nr:DNA topoisomerase I [Candidatus Nanoarchaeia archaeon]